MLAPGYNLVTERVVETDAEMPALAFFRTAAADDPIDTPVTVTRVEDLLYHVAADDRTASVGLLRTVLRETDSLAPGDPVQLLLDGRFVDGDVLTLRIDRQGEFVDLPVGELFVEAPRPRSVSHRVARK